MLSHIIKKNLVPIKNTKIDGLLRNHQDGKIKNINLDKGSGFTTEADNIKAKIQKTHTSIVISQGNAPNTKLNDNLSKNTLSNYQCEIASKVRKSMWTYVTQTIKSRYLGENPLISVITLVSIVASIYYDISFDMCFNIGRDMCISNVSESVKMLNKMICKAYCMMFVYS